MRSAHRGRAACRPSRASPAPSARSMCSKKYLDHLLSYVDRRSCASSRSSSTPATAAPGWSSTSSSRICRSSSSRSTTSPTARFPNGVPNPMLEENRAADHRGDPQARAPTVGLAWDGDYDRCFFFDEQRRVHRGLLPRRPAGRGVPEARARRAHRARSAPDLEHDRHRRSARRQGGAVQVRPRFHQGRRCARSTAPMAAR